ncbi:RNA chaperone Hfq [Bombella mellum]|uniref:RNA-binding protein Hfq n=1 Tax=Bombella mellum TaxID=2039288 RepID=A0ABR5ZSS5_9PROT|nr:RNA chaperone Hfq [Bombella mellum]MBA5727361.1 RNA chaperone Hfq [Bombella mellum]
MSEQTERDVQEQFLAHVQQREEPVTVFLVNGVKLQGVITRFDAHSVLLRRDGHVQLVYKHAVSTIMPVAALSDLS